ncbi:MAG: hypothetical protein JKX73_02495 [Flavobacteriales bacterium]|nr:hypothetical protein [Flavobacteriales bacterium]
MDRYAPKADYKSMVLSRSEAAVIRSDSDFFAVFLDSTVVVDVDWNKTSLIGMSVYTPYEVKKEGSSLCVDHEKKEYYLSVYLTTKESKPDSIEVEAWYQIPVLPANYTVVYSKSVD